MLEGKSSEQQSLPKLEEDAELSPGLQAQLLQQKPDRQRLSLDELGAIPEEEHQDQEAQKLLQKAEDAAGGDVTEKALMQAELVVNGIPRSEVAQKLEHALAHDPDLLALKAEIYKKYGQKVYSYAFETGIPGMKQHGSHEMNLEDWYSQGKDYLMMRLRSLAEHTSQGVLRERKTRAQHFKGRVFDTLRGSLPDRVALGVLSLQSRKRRKQ